MITATRKGFPAGVGGMVDVGDGVAVLLLAQATSSMEKINKRIDSLAKNY